MNIEEEVISYLADCVEVPVFADVPQTRPSEFITVERTGGGRDIARNFSTLAIQCWADTRYHASELAREASLAMLAFSFAGGISKVEVSNEYNFPDPDSNQPRYQLTCEIASMN